MVRSCCLVSCLFSGRSAELLGTGTSPYAFVNFLSCRQSRVRHWPRYISYRLAFSWILLCSLVHLSQCILWAYIGSLAVGGCLGSTCTWITRVPCSGVGIVMYKRHLPIHVASGQWCLQGTRVIASVRGLRSLVFHCLFLQLLLGMLWTSLGKPVHLAVCRCPHTHGSLLFVVVSGFLVTSLSLPPLPSTPPEAYPSMGSLRFGHCGGLGC